MQVLEVVQNSFGELDVSHLTNRNSEAQKQRRGEANKKKEEANMAYPLISTKKLFEVISRLR